MRKLLTAATLFAMTLTLSGCVIDDTYASCFDTSDCNDVDDQCLEVDIPAENTFGGFCSRGCTSDFQCETNFGFDGVCYALDSSAAICFQQCNVDSDCWSRNVCIPVDLGGGLLDYVCVPNGG